MEALPTTFRQVLAEQLAGSLQASPPSHTPRRVYGLTRFPGKATAVVGMRRAGKTTFLHQLRQEFMTMGAALSRAPYVSFEDERLTGLEARHLDLLLDEYQRHSTAEPGAPPVMWCFDEIQLVPGWERFVRRLLDTEAVQVFVTGASAALLSREIATALRGRAWQVLMHPFGFDETLRHQGMEIPERTDVMPRGERMRLEQEFAAWLVAGGFPEAQGLDTAPRHQLLRDYVDVAVLRDVVERHGVGNVTGLRWLVRQLLGNAGGSFSVEKFQRRAQVPRHRHRQRHGAPVPQPPRRLLSRPCRLDGVEFRAPAHGESTQGVSRGCRFDSGVRPRGPRQHRPCA